MYRFSLSNITWLVNLHPTNILNHLNLQMGAPVDCKTKPIPRKVAKTERNQLITKNNGCFATADV